MPAEENREERERIEAEPDRYLEIPGLDYGDAHSDAKRPLFPIQSGHRFRFNPATDSDAKRPVGFGM